jgi:hypothetical protein
MIRVTKRFYSMPKPIFHMLRRIALVVHCACQCVRFLIASPWCTVVFHTYRIVVFLLATSRTHRSIPRPSTGSRASERESRVCVCHGALSLCACQAILSIHPLHLSIYPSIHPSCSRCIIIIITTTTTMSSRLAAHCASQSLSNRYIHCICSVC